VEFQDVVRRRRMVRSFLDRPVPQQSVERILRNAVRGPSAGFCQGQAFLVLAGEQLPAFWAVGGEAAYPSVQTAPLVIVPLSSKRIYIDQYVQNAGEGEDWTDEARMWPVPFWHIDTGMAALLILQTVVDEGLAACYFGIMPDAVGPLRERFGIPAGYEPIGAIAIGYDAEASHASLSARRRPFGEMVHYGRW
jgi:nitroreductase